MIDIALSNIVYNSFFASTTGMNLRLGTYVDGGLFCPEKGDG